MIPSSTHVLVAVELLVRGHTLVRHHHLGEVLRGPGIALLQQLRGDVTACVWERTVVATWQALALGSLGHRLALFFLVLVLMDVVVVDHVLLLLRSRNE